MKEKAMYIHLKWKTCCRLASFSGSFSVVSSTEKGKRVWYHFSCEWRQDEKDSGKSLTNHAWMQGLRTAGRVKVPLYIVHSVCAIDWAPVCYLTIPVWSLHHSLFTPSRGCTLVIISIYTPVGWDTVKCGIQNSGITLIDWKWSRFVIADITHVKQPSSEVALLMLALPSVFWSITETTNSTNVVEDLECCPELSLPLVRRGWEKVNHSCWYESWALLRRTTGIQKGYSN